MDDDVDKYRRVSRYRSIRLRKIRFSASPSKTRGRIFVIAVNRLFGSPTINSGARIPFYGNARDEGSMRFDESRESIACVYFTATGSLKALFINYACTVRIMRITRIVAVAYERLWISIKYRNARKNT